MDSKKRLFPPPAPLSPQLRRKLDRHFLACSATLGATLAGVTGGTHEAKADIIYSGTRNISVPFNDTSGIYFDFDTGTTSTVNVKDVSDANVFDTYGTYKNYTYHGIAFLGPNSGGNGGLATLSTPNDETLKLSIGDTIGPNPSTGMFSNFSNLVIQLYNFTTHAKVGPLTGHWASGGTGFIGFQFVDAHGQTDYGWMRVNLNINNFFSDQASATIIDWAYNNSGTSITAGQIPEPNSIALALLGSGAVGLAIWRRQRRQKQSPPKA
jgi:PEP-CTERM motif